MKFIKDVDPEIILEENDKVIISTMQGNKRKIIITYNNGSLEIDEVAVDKIELIKQEEEAIKVMKEYNKKNCTKKKNSL